jgi:hypothetical protein
VVSIVLPTYNRERYIPEAIASCLAQTLAHFELLVVDDGSQGAVRELVEAVDDPRVAYLRHARNLGLPAALNTGFSAARGAYFTWTSDDNRYHPTALARMAAHLDSHPDVGLVYAGCRLIDADGRSGEAIRPEPPEAVWTMNCVRACFLYRQEVARAVGPYDRAIPLVEDYDYWLRIARRFRLEALPEILYDLRVHGTTLTQTRTLDQKRESYVKALAKLRDPSVGPPVSRATARRARAAMHARCGRDYFLAGQAAPARRNLLAAVCYEPSRLLDRTTAGLLVRSVFAPGRTGAKGRRRRSSDAAPETARRS